MRASNFALAALFLLLSAATSYAAETLTYIYDAQGRVIQVHSTGSVNGPSTTTYTYDKAHNRVQVNVVKS